MNQILLNATEMMFLSGEPEIFRDTTPEKSPLIIKFKPISQNLLLKYGEEPLPERMESDIQKTI